MATRKLSVPHVRRKALLRSRKLNLEVQIADRREKLDAVKMELKAMTPKKPTTI